MLKTKTVVLTGGVGSRLWPLSRKNRPKQYLPLFDSKTLFSLTIERNIAITNEFVIVGNSDNRSLSSYEMDNYNVNYLEIVESLPRNTAAAIAFSAFACNDDDILLVVPSDHIIENLPEYHNSVKKAISLAQQGYIVTFGIVPTKPETGYGYIEFEGENVISFREKPNRETAISFLNQKKFYWNSGMFCFKASTFLNELEKYESTIYTLALEAWKKSSNGFLSKDDLEKIPSKSIDYAVMEHSSKIKVVNGSFDWSDLGSFESLYCYFLRNGKNVDKNGNMYIGSNEKMIEFLGMHNTIFVETEDANLILRKEDSQEVKNIYENLEKNNSSLI